MAEVFLAACEVEPSEYYPVVVKRLYPHFGDDPAAVQMLRDEARLVASLSHPNIVKLYEVGILEERHCIAMEYLEGQPLQRLMQSHGQRSTVPVALAIHIVIQVLDALEYAHNATDKKNVPLRIIHRDISPQNVFITNDGQVKLLDFGIAKAESHEGRTVTGLVKGKFAYIAPEQAMGHVIDRRADLWSIGVILWELLAGKRLFKADNEAATLRATLRAVIPSLTSVRPEIPAVLEGILGRSLQRQPALRYANAQAMKSELENCLRSLKCSVDSYGLSAFVKSRFEAEILKQKRLLERVQKNESFSEKRGGETNRSTFPTLVTKSNVVISEELLTKSVATECSLQTNGLSKRAWIASLVSVVLALLAFLTVAKFSNQKPLSKTEVNSKKIEGAVKVAPVVVQSPTDVSRVVNVGISMSSEGDLDRRVHSKPLPKSRLAVGHSIARAPIEKEIHALVKEPVVVATPTPLVGDNAIGFLTLDTTPWSSVSIKGKTIGQTPLIHIKLPTGIHTLVLSNPDLGIETSFSVKIVEGETTTKRVGLQ
jgi:serine/threonine-protein kinase